VTQQQNHPGWITVEKQKPIVVIGSNSFSGAHFVDFALRQGTDVIGVSRSDQPASPFLAYRWPDAIGDRSGQFQFHALDLNHDTDAIEQILLDREPAYVVNFAAQSMVAESWLYPEHWYQTNVVANVLLHDCLRKMPFLKKYVHISTPEVYGSCEGTVTEDAPMNPSTPYAASRAACDMHLMTFQKNYDFPVVFTRAANVYGPGQQLYRIIPRAILYASTGQRLPLHGGGHSVRSFIHIRDVAVGTWQVMQQANPPSIYHFSTDQFIKIRDLVALIAERMGIAFDDLVEITDDRPGKDKFYQLSSDRARQALDWQASIDLEAGVEETVAWVEQHLDELKDLPHAYEHKA
jgi:dTDP-glucose 4,6-dehydratase